MTDDERVYEAAKALYFAAAEAIREASETGPLYGMPAGVLYFSLSGAMNLKTFNSMIGSLKNAGLVVEENNLLKWVGKPTDERKGGKA